MLINAQSPEEVRVAIVSDTTLDEYLVEVADQSLTRGNIYRGTIASVQPSLNAAFIEYGGPRHGFLSIQDMVPEAWYKQPKDKKRPRIDEVLERGRPIVVQVTKDSEGDKGAVMTTDLSLAGRYLVFTPFNETRGVSRKVEDDADRKRLKDAAKSLDVPEGSGVIVRTNALGQTKATLARDLASLLRLWKRVSREARQGKGTKLLYSDQDLIFRALRDTLDGAITEILVDDDEAHDRADKYLTSFMPRSRPKLIRYSERTPLFSKYRLEEQVDAIYQRSVPLPSGGSLVIDPTEALTAIDVNSGKSTKASTQEETAVNTNLEAAREVARQLRLRDIGGLLVVDFIDMRSTKNQRKVEKELRDAMKADKARSTVGRISSNGLLEINRQRIRQALSVRTHRPCPTCSGTGRIPSPELVSLNLLRRIETRAAAGGLEVARIALHPELADAFQNTRRTDLAALEQEFGIRVEVIASPKLHRSEQEVDWLSAGAAAAAAAADSAGSRGSGRDSRSSRGSGRSRSGGSGRGRGRSSGRGSDKGSGRGSGKDSGKDSGKGSGKGSADGSGDGGRRRSGRGGSRKGEPAVKASHLASEASGEERTEEPSPRADGKGDDGGDRSKGQRPGRRRRGGRGGRRRVGGGRSARRSGTSDSSSSSRSTEGGDG
jgi:ribonuclease E